MPKPIRVAVDRRVSPGRPPLAFKTEALSVKYDARQIIAMRELALELSAPAAALYRAAVAEFLEKAKVDWEGVEVP